MMNRKELEELCKDDDWYKKYKKNYLERNMLKIMLLTLLIPLVVFIINLVVR